MMKLLSLLIACLLAVATPAFAQKSQAIEYDDFQLHNARATTHDGTFVSVDRSNTVSFDVLISGTSATVVFRVSGAASNGWQELLCYPSDSTSGQTSVTASGLYTCNVAGGNVVSARVDECTSCSVSVVARRTTAVLGGGSSGGSTSWASLLATGAMGTSETVPFSIRGIGGQSTNGWDFYQSSGGVWTDVCIVSSVPNACHYIRQLSATYTFEIRNASATAIFTVSNDTGALTNVTLNAEGTGNTITIQEEVWWDVAACQNTTASLIWDVPTANSPAAACDTGSNTQKAYASFDATTDESFEMNWVLPTGWTGAIDMHFIWKAAATSGAVGWCAQLIRVADGATSDPAYPAQASGNCVSDTAKGTTLQENRANITGVTCTSCAAGDHVYVRISRDANGGAVTDDMAGDAHLMKVGRTWRVAK